MANFPFPDIIGYPSSGIVTNLHSIICGAPKGATNQYLDVSYYGDSLPQPTGNNPYNILSSRFHIPSVVVSLSG